MASPGAPTIASGVSNFTVRDEFALRAMQAIICDPKASIGIAYEPDDVAARAYRIADAMVRQSEQTVGLRDIGRQKC